MKLHLLPIPVLLALAAIVPAQAHDTDSQTGPLGKVSFPTSCDPKVQPAFERSVAMLHSFWYSAAEKAFRDVLKDDPQCAIATWGVAAIIMSNPLAGQGASPKGAVSAQAAIDDLIAGRRPFFVYPLQLQTDYQLRSHSPFHQQQDAIRLILRSFAENAAEGTDLVVKLHPLGDLSHHVPNDVLRDSLSPRRPMSADGAEDSARGHLRGLSPSIDCILDPSRHRNGTDMTALADQVHDGPMSLSDLQILNAKSRELGPAQSATHEHRNHCEITRTAQVG